MRIRLEYLRHFIPSRVILIGFAWVLVPALVGSCSILDGAPREYVSTTTITPMIERDVQGSKLVILGQEQVEVVNLETNKILSMPFDNLYWHEVDLARDRGISPTGLLAARVLGPDGERNLLEIQIVNANDGIVLASIPLFLESQAATLFDETNAPIDSDVTKMLLGGWAAPRWSPDGSMLAFMAARDGDSSDVYIFHLEEGNIEHLTQEPEQANVIGWSPDSTTVIYAVGRDFETYRYNLQEIRSHDLQTGDDERIVEVFDWEGVHIFGWHSDVEVLFSYFDAEQDSYRNLMLGNIQTSDVQLLFEGVLEDAAVEPYASAFALALNDNPVWGSGIFLGSLYTRDFEQVLDWGGVYWHDLDWVITENRFTVGSSDGSLLFDSKLMQLDAFDQENCPPLPSPDGAWMLFGTCDGEIFPNYLKLYRRWESKPEIATDEFIEAQLWQIDSEGFIYLTTEGDVYAQPSTGNDRQLLWSGNALDIALIAPIAERESVRATQQAAPTLTPRPTSTPTMTPTWAPTSTPETPEILAHLSPGEPILFDEIKMINARVGWAVTARETAYKMRRSYHLLRTEDAGLTWSEVTPPELIKLSDSSDLTLYGYFLDEDHAWAMLDGGFRAMVVWRTEDGGRTWRSSRIHIRGQSGEAWPILFFNNQEQGWLLISYFMGMHNYEEDFMRTQDGGKTWESILLEDYQHGPIRDFQALNSSVAWITSGLGISFYPSYRMHLTRDGGLTWEHVIPDPRDYTSPLPGDCILHEPRLKSYLSGRVLRSCKTYEDPPNRYFFGFTDDGGRAWRYVEIPGVPYSVGDRTGWAMATSDEEGAQIYQTRDGGYTWSEIANVDWIGSLTFVDDLHGWAIADGKVRYSEDGGRTWVVLEASLRSELDGSVDLTAYVYLPDQLLPIDPSMVERINQIAEFDATSPTSLAINDRALYIGLANGRLVRWPWKASVINPHSLPRLRLSERWIYDIDVSMDRPGFVAASQDGHAYLYDDYFYPLLDITPAVAGELSGVALLADEVLAAGEDGILRVWGRSSDSDGWETRVLMQGHEGWVWDVDVSPDEYLYASGGADTTVRLWDSDAGQPLSVMRGHSSAVTKVRFSHDGAMLASSSRDGSVRLWDVEAGEEIAVLQGHNDWVLDLSISPEGNLLASVDADGEIILWDIGSGALLRRWRAHQGSVRGVVFSPDGSLLITAGEDDLVKLWGIEP